MKTRISSLAPTALGVGALLVTVLAPQALAEQGTPPAGDPARGAKVWADNCSRCHNMRDPREFTDGQWQVIVTHMRLRGGLTGQDARDILAFLQASN